VIRAGQQMAALAQVLRPEPAQPGFTTYAGFIVSTALILALSGLLYLAFKAKDWL
jgi:hypothetical protein